MFECQAAQNEDIPTEIDGIQCVEKVMYLGMTITTGRWELVREAKNSIRRNLTCLRHKLRSAEIDVKEQVLISFCRSITIYFGTPLVAAGIWADKDIDAIEKGYFYEIMLLPRDLNRSAVSNVTSNCTPVKKVIRRLASKIVEVNSKQKKL